MSIIAVAPASASARPARQARLGRELARAQRGGRRRLAGGGALDQFQRRGGAPQLAGHREDVARAGPGPGDEPGVAGLVADRGHGHRQHRRAGDVAADHAGAGAAREAGDALGEAEAELLLAFALGQADDDVGLAGLGAHRREIAERRRQRLVADRLGREFRQREVDSLDDRVDAGRGRAERLGDGGVVAGADPHPRALARQHLPQLLQEAEFAHVRRVRPGRNTGENDEHQIDEQRRVAGGDREDEAADSSRSTPM